MHSVKQCWGCDGAVTPKSQILEMTAIICGCRNGRRTRSIRRSANTALSPVNAID